MNKNVVRLLLYAIIASGQTFLLGLEDVPMTTVSWVKLIVSCILAAAITLRALFDQEVSPISDLFKKKELP